MNKLDPDKLPKYYLGIWGIERSGTNWLEVLLKKNIKDTFVTSFNKHAHRPSDFSADKHKNQHIKEIYGEEARFVAIIKNPWAWAYSNFVKWKRPVLPRFNIEKRHLTSLEDRLCIYYNRNNESYLDMANDHSHRCIIITYEELLEDPEKTIKYIASSLNLPIQDKFDGFIKTVGPALHLTKNKFNSDFYKNKQYLNKLTQKQIKYIDKNASPKIMKYCNYKSPLVKTMQYTIDKQSYEIEYRGDSHAGADICLIDQEKDLTKGTEFHRYGFVVKEFLNEKKRELIRKNLLEGIAGKLYDLSIIPKDFEKYYNWISEEEHKNLIDSLYGDGRGLNAIDVFGAALVEEIEDFVSIVLKRNVSMQMPGRDIQEIYCRIVRPSATTSEYDNNPPHRDVWVPRLKNAINIFFPVVGCDENSILPIIPGSHFWKESEINRTSNGALIGSRNYTVPIVTDSKYGLDMIRPSVTDKDILIFSPYLIHGGGINLNTDATRISLEIRFWESI